MWVQGVGGTTVNGSTAPVLVGPLADLSASLGDGNDQFVLVDVSVGTLTVETGNGNDLLALSDVAGGPASVSNSAGADEIRILDSNIAGLTTDSDGLISVEGTVVNGNLVVSASGIGNTVLVQNSVIAGGDIC